MMRRQLPIKHAIVNGFSQRITRGQCLHIVQRHFVRRTAFQTTFGFHCTHLYIFVFFKKYKHTQLYNEIIHTSNAAFKYCEPTPSNDATKSTTLISETLKDKRIEFF